VLHWAVAVPSVSALSVVGGPPPGGHDGGMAGLGEVVVADPGFEQGAEDVQLVGLSSPSGEKADEQSSRPGRPGRQVQIGNEEDQTTSAFSMITSSAGTS
jgi:hypothetical protein